MMCHSLLAQNQHNPYAVPVKRWWQVIVVLLRCCVNLVSIELPPEWFEITWYGNVFPEVPSDTKRQLNGGRWRWGKDTDEYKEVLEERGLQWESGAYA
jgi:hypothetical protein